MRPSHTSVALAASLTLLAATAAQADVMHGPAAAALIVVPLVVLAFSLVGAVLTFVALVRLLHRTGHSGWWALLMFIPVVNFICFLIWAFTRNGNRPISP